MTRPRCSYLLDPDVCKVLADLDALERKARNEKLRVLTAAGLNARQRAQQMYRVRRMFA